MGYNRSGVEPECLGSTTKYISRGTIFADALTSCVITHQQHSHQQQHSQIFYSNNPQEHVDKSLLVGILSHQDGNMHLWALLILVCRG